MRHASRQMHCRRSRHRLTSVWRVRCCRLCRLAILSKDLVVVASVGLSQFRVTPDEDAYVPTALAALPSGGLVVRERCQSSGRFQVFKSLQLRFAWIGLAVLIGLEAS